MTQRLLNSLVALRDPLQEKLLGMLRSLPATQSLEDDQLQNIAWLVSRITANATVVQLEDPPILDKDLPSFTYEPSKEFTGSQPRSDALSFLGCMPAYAPQDYAESQYMGRSTVRVEEKAEPGGILFNLGCMSAPSRTSQSVEDTMATPDVESKPSQAQNQM
jgi:hypothetical protein